MEVRKVIGFGKNSQVVSIPKSWARKNLLKKGDLLRVKENHNEIIFSTDDKPAKREPRAIVIEAYNKPMELIKAEIVSAYLNNYDSIEIISIGLSKNAPVIKEIIRNLSGLEIINQTSNKIVANDLLNVNEISVKTIIRRMDVIGRAMIDDTIECIKGENNWEDISQRDSDMNRLYFLASRVIRNAFHEPSVMNSASTPWELLTERFMVSKLEMIADQQKRISRSLKLKRINFTNKHKDELIRIYNIMKENYLKAMKSYYNNDKKIAFEVEVGNKERISLCNDFLNNVESCFYATIIVENLKAMSTSIKLIARLVIEA